MRLIGFLPFLLIGIIVGLVATKLFDRSAITALVNCLIGIVAALMGLFMRDLFDLPAGVLPGMLSAAVASVAVVVVVNVIGQVFVKQSSKINHPP